MPIDSSTLRWEYDRRNNELLGHVKQEGLNLPDIPGYSDDQNRPWEKSIPYTIHEDNISEVSVTQHESAIDHNNLDNYVGDEHINHTSVSYSGGEGISGSGDLTQGATFDLALDSLTAETTLGTLDSFVFYDDSAGTHKKIEFSDFEGEINHNNLLNVGNNTHSQIDSHISDSTIHFTEGSIDHTNIQNVGTNSHAQIDTHIGDSTIHFTESSIDHNNIQNVGTNTHSQIDSHISDGTIHFTEGSIRLTEVGEGISTPSDGDVVIYDGANSEFENRLLVESDIPNLSAGKIISGTFADARISESSVTQHESALTITASQVSNFNEAVYDDVAGFLSAGAGISISRDDPTNTITITNTGTSGGDAQFSGAEATLNTSYSLSNNSATFIPWDGEVFDTDNYHDAGTNPTRLTVPNAGKYYIGGTIEFSGWATLADGRFVIQLYKNGAWVREFSDSNVDADGTDGPAESFGTIVDAAQGDYFELQVRQASGSSRDITTRSVFYAARLQGSGPSQLADLNDVTSVNYTSGRVLRANGAEYVSAQLSTDDVSEGTNLYFTDSRAVSAIKNDPDWNASNWDTAYTERGSQIAGTNLTWNGTQLDATDTNTQLNVGSENQIPFVNSSGSDLEYSSDLRWDDTSLLVGGNVDVSNKIILAPITSPTYAEGQLWYSADTTTLSFQNDRSGVTLNIGEETWLRVRNESGAQISNGEAVYISGFSTGAGFPTIELAQADSATTSDFAGLATEDIPDNASGMIATYGLVREVDTSAYVAGDSLFLSPSTPGALTTTEPSAPNFSVRVGRVSRSNASAGQILVGITDIREAVYTQGSIPYADANGRLIDDNANLSWDGTDIFVGGNAVWHAGDFTSTDISNWNTAYSERGSQIDGTLLNWNGTQLDVQESSIDHNNLTNTHNLTTDIDHNQLTNYDANEHRVWENSITQNIHEDNITQSAITQHESALTITESQITDGSILARVGSNEAITGNWSFQSTADFDDTVGLRVLSSANTSYLQRFNLASDGDAFWVVETGSGIGSILRVDGSNHDFYIRRDGTGEGTYRKLWHEADFDNPFPNGGDQAVGSSDNVNFNDGTFGGNVSIAGDLTVLGDKFVAEPKTALISDNLGLINFGETGAGVTAGFAGWAVDRGTNDPYRWGFEESSGYWKIGQYYTDLSYSNLSGTFNLHEEIVGDSSGAKAYIVSDSSSTLRLKGKTGSFTDTETITGQDSGATATVDSTSITDELQAVATREDSPTNNALAFWNSTDMLFETDSNLTWDGTDLSIGGSNAIVVGDNVSDLNNDGEYVPKSGGTFDGQIEINTGTYTTSSLIRANGRIEFGDLSTTANIGFLRYEPSNDLIEIGRNDTGNREIKIDPSGNIRLADGTGGDVTINGNTAWHDGNVSTGSNIDITGRTISLTGTIPRGNLPSEIAYTDESNTFSQDQTVNANITSGDINLYNQSNNPRISISSDGGTTGWIVQQRTGDSDNLWFYDLTNGTTQVKFLKGGGVEVSGNLDATSLSYGGQDTDLRYAPIAEGGSNIAGTNLTWDGTQLNATDTDTTYSAGAGLDLSGTTFSLSINTLTSLGASPASDDLIAIYDSSASDHKEISYSELESGLTITESQITGANFSNWDTAYDDSVTGVSGNGNGTLTINRRNSTNLTADLAHNHVRGDLPSAIAYTDEKNVFDNGAFDPIEIARSGQDQYLRVEIGGSNTVNFANRSTSGGNDQVQLTLNGNTGNAEVNGNVLLTSVIPSDLTAINSPTDGQIPSYDSGSGNFEWVNAGGSVSSIDDLIDVASSTESADDLLFWNAGNSQYENRALAAGDLPSHTHVLADITDSGDAAAKGVTGLDTNVVTGTAGTGGNLPEWNGDGDLVDSMRSISDFVTGAAGSDHQIQYNNGGDFGATSQLHYDDTNNLFGAGLAEADVHSTVHSGGSMAMGAVHVDGVETTQENPYIVVDSDGAIIADPDTTDVYISLPDPTTVDGRFHYITLFRENDTYDVYITSGATGSAIRRPANTDETTVQMVADLNVGSGQGIILFAFGAYWFILNNF